MAVYIIEPISSYEPAYYMCIIYFICVMLFCALCVLWALCLGTVIISDEMDVEVNSEMILVVGGGHLQVTRDLYISHTKYVYI